MINTVIPKFTYIIPFRFRQDRIIPLRRVVDWLSGFQNCEVLIIEQDSHSKIEHLNIRANHFFVKSEVPFNKSWAYNIGIRRSTAPVIIFGDADVIMDPLLLIESLKSLQSCDCVIPIKEIIKLNPQESLIDPQSIINRDRVGDGITIGDGLIIFKRDAISAISGWNEDILGTGGGYDNKFQAMKVEKLLNYKKMDYKGYHFFHHQDPIDLGLMQRNQQIMDQFKNDSDNSILKSHINITSQRIGCKNKYV